MAVLSGASPLVSAQDASPDGPRTIAPGEVRTWTFEREGQTWAMRPATPTPLGDSGLFRLVGSAYTLPRKHFSVGIFRDNVDRDPKGTDFSVHGFTVGYGATHRLELFGAVGIEHRVRARYLGEAGGPNEYPFVDTGWDTGFGDVWLGAKYALLSDVLGDGVGLGLRGFFKIPTADADKGLGTGKAAFGGDILLSKALAFGDVHAMAGYEVNGNPDAPPVPEAEVPTADTTIDPDYVASALRWGAGLNLPAGRGLWFQAEVSGRIYGDTTVEQTNTFDVIVGATFWLRPGLFLRPAWSYALGYDGRGRDVSTGRRSGFSVALGFHGGTPCCEVRAPLPPPPTPPR